ncbi:hypothetical protein U1R68_08695 [Pectobacterium colocasium]|uniref:hypothetical protein n=1 Tax=Pectobacterium colocasium TaxID=2878098 RepID=UPI001CD1AA75|nr:hypothetical protein [Pectobacterium colocasium]
MKLNILSRLRKKLSDLVFFPNFVAQLPKSFAAGMRDYSEPRQVSNSCNSGQ